MRRGNIIDCMKSADINMFYWHFIMVGLSVKVMVGAVNQSFS